MNQPDAINHSQSPRPDVRETDEMTTTPGGIRKAFSAILCASVAGLLPVLTPAALAQSDVIKPFRPGGNNPPKEEPARPLPKEPAPRKPRVEETEKKEPEKKEMPPREPKPAAPDAAEPAAVRPTVLEKPEPAPAKPMPPEAAEPAPVRPMVIPSTPPKPEPATEPAEPAAPSLPPKPAATAPVPAPKPPPDPMEEGDIVVRPNAAPTSADQVQLRYADGFFARKLWRDATPEYERYLEQYPKAPPEDRQAAFYRLGECYRQTGAMNNARMNYEAIVANFSGGDYVGYAASRLGKILYEEKEYRSALQTYRKASVRLKQPTLINDAKFFIGRCLEGVGQKTEAKVQYEDLAAIVESNPYRDASRLSVGRLLEDSGQRDGALKWLLPLSEDSANTQIKAEATARAALLLADVGKYDEAIAKVNAALEMPEAASWKDRLNFALFRIPSLRKDYKGVLARYEAGGANSFNLENKLNVLVLVGEAHRELGQRDAAMAIYDQIAREFSTTPQARDAAYARLLMLYDTGDQRLLEEVNKFLNENPTAPQVERVSLMKAEALFKAGDFEHAAPIYAIVLEKAKGLAGDFRGEAAFKLGWSYVQLRHYDRAIDTFAMFIKNHPTHAKIPTALAQRGAANMQLKQYTAAQKDFQDLTTKYPGAKEREFGLENLALIHSQLGDSTRMSDAFELLLRDYPETKAKAKAHFWIGCAAYDAKDYKKSIPHLTQARALDKAQYFERASLRLIAATYNMEDADATEKEIQFYRDNGGAAETQSDVIRWLGQKYFERGDYAKAEKFFPELIIRKEAIDEDKLMLARSRVKLGKLKDAVDSFNSYLATVKEPTLRINGLIEKADAQIAQSDWTGAEATLKEGLAMASEGRYNGQLRLRAGEIEVGRGNSHRALQIFESIPVTLDDEEVCPRALERAIEIYRKMGSEEPAKKLENQLRSKYPEYLQKKKKRIASP